MSVDDWRGIVTFATQVILALSVINAGAYFALYFSRSREDS